MGILNRLANTFRRSHLQQDAAEELAFHLEERTRQLRQDGMTDEQARLAAQRQVGNVTRIREETSDADLLQSLDALRRDFLLSFRTIRRAPLFAAVTILSLTLGIGANTMVFTVMKHVLVDSLPVANADRLVILHMIGVRNGHTSDDGIQSSFAYPQYQELAAATHSIFSGILARFGARVTLERQGASELVTAELVSGNYFALLGVQPWRGRLLTASDNQKPGAHPVAVLGYGEWQRTFGGDPNILNRTVRINSHPYTIVGITPPGFYGIRMDSPPDVYVPIMMKAQMTPTWDGLYDRRDHWATLVASLQPGVSLPRAQAALAAIYPPIRDLELTVTKSPGPNFLSAFSKNHIDLTTGGKGYADIRQNLEKPLQFVALMVLVVLLITIVNIANLLIARSASRERDMAVRLSIGAGRSALIRQVLVESLMLALTGGAFGILLAYTATPVLLKLLSENLNQSSITAHPDGPILLCMCCVSILSAVAFGLLPALQSARTDPSVALKSEGATGHTGGSLWIRRTLVGAQIVFSMLLLTGALLFTTSLGRLLHINPGFPTEHIVTFKIDPPGAGYSQAQIRTFTEDLLVRLRGLPHVINATLASSPVLEDSEWGNSITVEGSPIPKSEDAEVLKNLVSPGYFETFRLPILQGRSLTSADAQRKVVIVNAAFVNKFLPGQNPIGRHLEFSGGLGNPQLTWTIIGVVADSQHMSLRGRIQPFAWTPYLTNKNLTALTFYVRSAGNDAAVMKELRTTLRSVDPSLPLYDLHTLNEVISNQLFAERGLAALADVFAALAIILAAIGLYGVVSYSVTRRQREFGIRMAVGAAPKTVLLLVLKETALIGIISLACAMPLVLAGGTLIRSTLYGVQPDDPFICACAALALMTVALIAGLIPARQAALIDPQTALRNA